MLWFKATMQLLWYFGPSLTVMGTGILLWYKFKWIAVPGHVILPALVKQIHSLSTEFGTHSNRNRTIFGEKADGIESDNHRNHIVPYPKVQVYQFETILK